MREYQTPQSVANRIRLLRNSDNKKAFLIVEGAQDCRVYSLFACRQRCWVQWGYGRTTALEAGRLLDKDGFLGFVVAMDQDHWIIDGMYPKDSFVVWTDGRDLESTLMFAGVAERILGNFACPKELQAIKRETGKGVIEHLIDWCGALGAMRWVIVRGHLGLSCKEIDAFRGVDVDSFEISLERLADVIMAAHEGTLPFSRLQLKNRMVLETKQLLKRVGDQKWLYCRGHDLCRALTSGLREEFGQDLCQRLTVEVMEATVRSAYAWSDFEATQLHTRIRSWEGMNRPWRILADKQKEA